MRPFFSLLLVINNDAMTLTETLESILAQDYKFYELIIIDNASIDGSGKICREVAKEMDDIMFIKLYDKVSNGVAWNKALDVAQGDYVMFLTGNDKIFPDALNLLYMANETTISEVVNSVIWLEEDARGSIDLGGRKFAIKENLPFRDLQDNIEPNLDKLMLLRTMSSNAKSVPIATKIFKRKFLLDNAIRFDEQISDKNAKLLFTVDAMLRAEKIIFMLQPIYAAPKADTLREG